MPSGNVRRMRLERTPSSALAFVIALRGARALWSREVPLAIAVAFLVALPWHLRSLLVYGRAFLDQYLVFHVLGRFQAPLEGHEGGLLHYFDVYRYNAGWLAAIDTAGVTLALILAFLKRDRLLAAVVVLPLSAFALVSAQGTKIGWYLTPSIRAPRLPLSWRCPEQFTAAAASSSNTMFLTTARKFARSAACRPLRQGAFRCFTRWTYRIPRCGSTSPTKWKR